MNLSCKTILVKWICTAEHCKVFCFGGFIFNTYNCWQFWCAQSVRLGFTIFADRRTEWHNDGISPRSFLGQSCESSNHNYQIYRKKSTEKGWNWEQKNTPTWPTILFKTEKEPKEILHMLRYIFCILLCVCVWGGGRGREKSIVN